MRKINLERYKEKIEELYKNEKFSLVKVAKEIKVSASVIRKNMALWNIERRATRKRILRRPSKEELKNYYYDKKSIQEIIKELDIGSTTLFRWLKEYDINPARRFKYKKTRFSGGDREKAYLLGLVRSLQ